MLLLGGVIIEIAIAVAFLAYYFNTTIFATRLTAEALVAAQAGVDDALIKIVLNKNCPDSNCPSPYTLTVSRATADVTICKDTCAGAGKHEITSIGNSLNKKKKLRAVVQVDSTTGEVRTESINEIAL
mgnify:CR=1 FL=1